MIRTARPLQGKKLLKATLGIGTLTFAACGLFPGCNLVAPPQCPNTGGYDCYQPLDLAIPGDGNLDAAPGDGSLDAATKGD